MGDNDTLSAVVAVLCKADLLILLSDIDGLYDSDPHISETAKLIPVVYEINETIRKLAGGTGTCWGTGGMSTKLDAASICLESHIDMVITNGSALEGLYQILDGHSVGTLFTRRNV